MRRRLNVSCPCGGKQLGDRRVRKIADSLFELGFTRDADGNVLTTRERSRSDRGASVQIEGQMAPFPILRKQSVQRIEAAAHG